jgi:hypothetical protein
MRYAQCWFGRLCRGWRDAHHSLILAGLIICNQLSFTTLFDLGYYFSNWYYRPLSGGSSYNDPSIEEHCHTSMSMRVDFWLNIEDTSTARRCCSEVILPLSSRKSSAPYWLIYSFFWGGWGPLEKISNIQPYNGSEAFTCRPASGLCRSSSRIVPVLQWILFA